MFINKLNQLYKPKRILYYQEASAEQIEAFYQGVIPEKIAAHSGAFGTYDLPGIFYVKDLEKEVIGIEFRMDDERITYPSDLSSVILEGAFFYSVEIDEEIKADRVFIDDLFAKIARDDDAHRAYTDLNIADEPALISVFTSYKKIRILYEAKVYSDKAGYIIKDDAEHFDKEFLYKAAYTDFITGHYTWNHLVAFLEMPMKAGITDYAFAHFDIKQFRVINETFGHIAANKVLCNVVDAMNRADFVYASARCHNDNFAMIIKDMPDDEMIRTLEHFFEGLSRLEEDENYKIYYRCGVVPMQRTMLSGNRVADAGKMAQALGTGRAGTQITLYTDKMHDDVSWGNYIKGYVETAIKEDEFVVYFQPKFDIRKEKLKGAEALIRWNYKKREFLPPSKFIPFFERDGSIGEIDDVVLRKVCRALARWKEEGKPLYPVSVNLSRERLYEEDLIDHLVEIVDENGIDHHLIDFELTESATYDNMDYMLGILAQLRDRGFQISMDDFGTGYSSLSLLTRMPIDTLKIDKSFVDPVSTSGEREEDITVLRHIITLAKELGFATLAEGAESRSQVDRLRELGCEVIQGYYYSKPVPEAEYEKFF
ncbi:MAG: GGDEF domain-containing phosphodiesterase [Lachnospiraceae bacterium]|nr:GGDEF domain-containing phosphodiesterase [Lachnospiraceae bacterium]